MFLFTKLRNTVHLGRKNVTSDALVQTTLGVLYDVRSWVSQCLPDEVLPPPLEFIYELANGVVLAKLANKIAPHLVSLEKIYDRDLNIYKTKGLNYKHTENIQSFLKALRFIQFSETLLFTVTDVFERKNLPSVLRCLQSLALSKELRKALPEAPRYNLGTNQFDEGELKVMGYNLGRSREGKAWKLGISSNVEVSKKKGTYVASPSTERRVSSPGNASPIQVPELRARVPLESIQSADDVLSAPPISAPASFPLPPPAGNPDRSIQQPRSPEVERTYFKFSSPLAGSVTSPTMRSQMSPVSSRGRELAGKSSLGTVLSVPGDGPASPLNLRRAVSCENPHYSGAVTEQDKVTEQMEVKQEQVDQFRDELRASVKKRQSKPGTMAKYAAAEVIVPVRQRPSSTTAKYAAGEVMVPVRQRPSSTTNGEEKRHTRPDKEQDLHMQVLKKEELKALRNIKSEMGRKVARVRHMPFTPRLELYLANLATIVVIQRWWAKRNNALLRKYMQDLEQSTAPRPRECTMYDCISDEEMTEESEDALSGSEDELTESSSSSRAVSSSTLVVSTQGPRQNVVDALAIMDYENKQYFGSVRVPGDKSRSPVGQRVQASQLFAQPPTQDRTRSVPNAAVNKTDQEELEQLQNVKQSAALLDDGSKSKAIREYEHRQKNTKSTTGSRDQPSLDQSHSFKPFSRFRSKVPATESCTFCFKDFTNHKGMRCQDCKLKFHTHCVNSTLFRTKGPKCTSKDVTATAFGVLRVQSILVENIRGQKIHLPNDVYLRLTLKDQVKKASAKRFTNNPRWENDPIYFTVNDLAENITVQALDYSITRNSENVLGEVQIPLTFVKHLANGHAQWLSYDFINKDGNITGGQIRLECHWYGTKRPYFGCPLNKLPEMKEGAGSGVPRLLEKVTEEIEAKGLGVQGIYRLSGKQQTVNYLQNKIDHDEKFTSIDLSAFDVNVLTNVLKLFLRELPDPLFTFEAFPKIKAAFQMSNVADRNKRLKDIVDTLPPENQRTLAYLMRHLKRVAANEQVNKMNVSNLAVVMGPNILKAPDPNENLINSKVVATFVEVFISEVDYFFPTNENEGKRKESEDHVTLAQSNGSSTTVVVVDPVECV
eukprot:comp22693_c0_seq2/m.35160 comp22693_c0_seq2/g.35160  ORF comp22693_c0_seq2/g.35160 comp22693_c0_seq2/m.35160 type:complete len:1112 (-) comp22693_c0_seq2:533-3868(-)